MTATKATASRAMRAISVGFGLAQRDALHDDQDDQAQDVVEHGGGEDDACRAPRLDAELPQHGDGDAHRGRHEGRGHEEGVRGGLAEGQGGQQTAGERERHADEAHAQGRPAHGEQLAHARLEAGLEEEEDHAQLGEGLEELGPVDQVEKVRTEQGAGEQLADHGRQSECAGEAAQQARGRVGDQELEQDGRHGPGLRLWRESLLMRGIV